MYFWEQLSENNYKTLLIDYDGISINGSKLLELVKKQEEILDSVGTRTLGFLLCDNRIEDIAMYLACLRRGHVPLLLAANVRPEQLNDLCDRYQPQWLFGAMGSADTVVRQKARPVSLHDSLALLLSTSGTTGSTRLVRLSHRALHANAVSIAEYLMLDSNERAITSLPMNYSYGLSVINSHLYAGASIVMNNDSVISNEFLCRVRDFGVTTLAGVPYVYQMLFRTGFFDRELPQLRTFTQAGGRMDDRLIKYVVDHTKKNGYRFFVMYGQTEACARISYVPPEYLEKKIGSIGVAIPGGSLSLNSENNEINYEGPNVMMGYAENRCDLALGDSLKGKLATGDIGRVDADGFFYVLGRMKRFIKIGGNRIGLDKVEEDLEARFKVIVSVSGNDDCMVVWIEGFESSLIDSARDYIRTMYGVHHTMTRIKLVDNLPLLPSGKKDYSGLLIKN